jgi:hypothetical protein
MERNEAIVPPANRPTMPNQAVASQNPFASGSRTMIIPQACGCPAGAEGSGDSATPPGFVFAIGKIEMRFPSLGIEKEFAQATGRAETAGLTDQQASANVLSKPENRYLARAVCWVMTIEGLETYILLPRDAEGLDLLLASVRPASDLRDIDVVIGLRGPVAPPELCNGLVLPMVVFDQVYSFDRASLINAIPPPKAKLTAKDEKQFRSAAGELYDQITQLADNAGATDEHRALNYLAVRYPVIYSLADKFGEDFAFAGVETLPSRLSGVRNIVTVVFSFTNRKTDVTEKYFVRVDVTEEFPFLVTKLQPYYDR